MTARNLVVGDSGSALCAAAITSVDTTIGGDDSITTREGADVVVGGAGSDTVDAGAGDNFAIGDYGSFASDLVTTIAPDRPVAPTRSRPARPDVVFGGSAADVISAGAGGDLVLGDNGAIALGDVVVAGHLGWRRRHDRGR